MSEQLKLFQNLGLTWRSVRLRDGKALGLMVTIDTSTPVDNVTIEREQVCFVGPEEHAPHILVSLLLCLLELPRDRCDELMLVALEYANSVEDPLVALFVARMREILTTSLN